MKIGIIAITTGGRELAVRLCAMLDDATLLEKSAGEKIAGTIAKNWRQYDALICIMAAGIVVRAVAPLLEDKFTDPCVVVLDEKGKHAISLLSGHIGGGNALARKVAGLLGGTAVITTSSDTLELVALDLWAQEQQLVVPDRKELTDTLQPSCQSGATLPLHRCVKYLLYRQVYTGSARWNRQILSFPITAGLLPAARSLVPAIWLSASVAIAAPRLRNSKRP